MDDFSLTGRIDLVCDRFEADLNAGKGPRIEDVLAGWQGTERAELLRQLLAVEIEFRRMRGERPAVVELAARFPDDAAVIRELLDEPGDRHGSRTDPFGPETMGFAKPPADDTVMLGDARTAAQPSGGIQRIGDYELLQEIARGGMGVVYRARHRTMDRVVAVKVLAPKLVASPEAVERFRREVRVAAQLVHPNVVTAYDAGTHRGTHYLVMEFVDGRDLAKLLRERGTFAVAAAVDIVRQIARGMKEAHLRGIIHRDIKPGNVLLDKSGVAKILDLGLARVENPTAEPDRQISQTGDMMGTVDFLSPEQAKNFRSADARSDVYSLGCTLYFLLAGRAIYPRESLIERLLAHRDDPIPSLRIVCPDASEELDAVFQHMVAKRPEDRCQSMAEVLEMLEGIATAAAVPSAPAQKTASVASATTVRESRLPAKDSLPQDARADWTSSRPQETLAVLPFANADSDPKWQYFCDGFTETVINNLSQLPGLRVLARSTVFRYKDREQDPQEVGRTLGVGTVLLGRIATQEGSLAISVELVSAADGMHLWGSQYRRGADDVLGIPEDIVREIAEALHIRLFGQEKLRVLSRPTANTAAYKLYLQGRFHLHKRTRDGFEQCIRKLREAIALDPDYALAYVGIADANAYLFQYGYADRSETYPDAKAAVDRALQLDPQLPEAHVAAGYVRHYFEWDWPGTKDAFQLAIQLKPNAADAYHGFAHCLMLQGDFDEALRHLTRARQLDPLSLVVNANIGYLYYLARRYDEAISQLNATLEIDADFSLAYFYLGQTYVQTGQYHQAAAAFKQASRLTPDDRELDASLVHTYALAGETDKAKELFDRLLDAARREYVPSYALAVARLGLGERDEALRLLEDAYDRRDPHVFYLKVEPVFDVLRSEAAFMALLARLDTDAAGRCETMAE